MLSTLSTLAAMNGMVVLTLSVSFIMNVWQATVDARALPVCTAALHGVAGEMDDAALADALAALGPDVARLVVAIRGLPVVGCFASEDSRMSFPLAVLALCEMVERVAATPPRPGLSELRLALARLGEGPAGTGAEANFSEDGLSDACRWAEARRLVS